MKDSTLSRKVKTIHIIILIFGMLIVFATVRWQGVEASRMNKLARQRSTTSEINSVRGTVFSSDGTTLAYSEPRFDMFVWVKDLEYYEKLKLQTRDEFLNKVAPIIDLTPEALGNIIDENTQKGIMWIPVAKALSDKQWNQLNDLTADEFETPLKGFQFENKSKRVYPEKRLASHVIGLTNVINDKTIGLGGVEESWNEILNPIKGILVQETNAKGEAIATALTATIEPKNGSAVHTSINKKLQETVQQKLKEGVEKYRALSGSVVIMDPKTGQIMALANYPDYDPNLREEKDAAVYGNEAVSAPYEMGSVGKALTIAAAVDLDKVDSETIILPDGHQGCEKFTDELGPLCTWDKKAQPPMPLKDCFAKSDNICLFHLARDHLSKEQFHDYLSGFGIGKSTGVDLAGESYWPMKDAKDFNIGDIAAMSYGHGYLVNLVQAVDSIAAIANNGVRMKPYVVTKVIDSDGKVSEYKPQILETVLKPETSEKMFYMMNYNYQKSIYYGEWWYNDILDYNIGVKSGTALIADNGVYSNEINASFVGFDQSPQRTFVMGIKLEKPQEPAGQNLSAYNVRPLWLDTFQAVKDIIGVPRK
jgi:cell division protein FtsI/penicillin-binding protein 2